MDKGDKIVVHYKGKPVQGSVQFLNNDGTIDVTIPTPNGLQTVSAVAQWNVMVFGEKTKP